MTTREIAGRLDARKIAKGWIARCPAHYDRQASLSINEGREGRVLLRCFAGCSVERIVYALGLDMTDLFDPREPALRASRHKRPPTAREIREALVQEAQTYRHEYAVEGEFLARELNAIRERIGHRYGVALPPLPRPLYEGGGYGGRDRDPAWPGIFAWALAVAGVEIVGVPFNGSVRPPCCVIIQAEDLAATAMRDLEHQARQHEQCAA
ncbi:MAG TPA: hypothetical protein VMV82_11230 [Candidatus Dormibacteraeota bacterium]|nr:hypothetical protein [Candidatus Dormibacteraeota bacterium]